MSVGSKTNLIGPTQLDVFTCPLEVQLVIIKELITLLCEK